MEDSRWGSPDVLGMKLEDAKACLEKSGQAFKTIEVFSRGRDKVEDGEWRVIRQRICRDDGTGAGAGGICCGVHAGDFIEITVTRIRDVNFGE